MRLGPADRFPWCFTCMFDISSGRKNIVPSWGRMSHLEHSSTLSLALGVGTGVVHHILFQWAQQASLFSTIQAFTIENLTFSVFNYWNFRDSVSQILHQQGLFLSSLVPILMDLLTWRSLLRCLSSLFTTSTFDIAVFPPSLHGPRPISLIGMHTERASLIRRSSFSIKRWV